MDGSWQLAVGNRSSFKHTSAYTHTHQTTHYGVFLFFLFIWGLRPFVSYSMFGFHCTCFIKIIGWFAVRQWKPKRIKNTIMNKQQPEHKNISGPHRRNRGRAKQKRKTKIHRTIHEWWNLGKICKFDSHLPWYVWHKRIAKHRSHHALAHTDTRTHIKFPSNLKEIIKFPDKQKKQERENKKKHNCEAKKKQT